MLVDGDHSHFGRASRRRSSQEERVAVPREGPELQRLSQRGGFQACRKHPFKRMKSSVVNTG